MDQSACPVIVDDLSFRYRNREELAIEDVSFSLQPGELLLIAGASGCGKTTLARCINGLIPRSYQGFIRGSVRLFGRDVSKLSLVEISQTVGTLLQDPERQIVSNNVYAEIAFGPENLGLSREEIHERVETVIDRLKIGHLRDRETYTLSGGEKQKVALAGLLVMQPSVLLLDEPLASLDPASAHEALRMFRSLADEGTTILLVEHRVEDALSIHPDRILYMSAGRVKFLGPVDTFPKEINYREVKLPAEWVVEKVRERQAEQPKLDRAPRTPVPTDQPLVVFEDVSFAYGDGPLVLHDINMEIHHGDLIAVLGPNGAGKSTLVKHTIGLLKPTRGRVLLEGQDTRKLTVAQTARKIGYVFQSPTSMLFAPTVREELSFGPENLKFTPDEIKLSVDNSIRALNLSGLEEYAPLGLSFGQQKRTTIASVMAMRSKIIIMDEPTAGQDFANYTHFMENLTSVSVEGQSILSQNFAATLFITHDLDLALTYANRILLVGNGRIVADGPPEEVLIDDQLLASCRIRPTSLLSMNREALPRTGRFLPAELLAPYVA